MDLANALLEVLDEISSSRSSLARKSRSLSTLERLLADLCLSPERSGQFDQFLELQDGFECNVVSRILFSLPTYFPAIQQYQHPNSQAVEYDVSNDARFNVLIQPLLQSLSVLQGLSLIHPASKTFLGRKPSLHILLDTLSLSRTLSTPSPSPLAISTNTVTSMKSTQSNPNASSSSFSPTLASAVLDTLLCILVDSPPALRVFEESSGIEGVVKILKRAGVARDVRMKCLEFLYFYLLPEDGSSPTPTQPPPTSDRTPPRTAPSSPTKPSRLAMLRKEVDFTPTTPKKPHFASSQTPRGPTSLIPRNKSPPVPKMVLPPSTPSRRKQQVAEDVPPLRSEDGIRTTEEKRLMLGAWVGNVDALVEGVQKAGVWGLA